MVLTRRAQCGKENLLVPVHAYPVAAGLTFPRRLEMGPCPLAEATTRVLELRCDVPIAFEYSLAVTRPHADITVAPLTGIIPANGSARVLVTFTPIKVASASAAIELSLSQFNFAPITCEIIASGAAGIVYARELEDARAAEPPPPPGAPPLSRTAALDPGTALLDERRARAMARAADGGTMGGGGRGTGGVGGATAALAMDTRVEGVRVPADLRGARVVTFVLTQVCACACVYVFVCVCRGGGLCR